MSSSFGTAHSIFRIVVSIAKARIFSLQFSVASIYAVFLCYTRLSKWQMYPALCTPLRNSKLAIKLWFWVPTACTRHKLGVFQLSNLCCTFSELLRSN